MSRVRKTDMGGLNDAAFYVFVPALVYRTAATTTLDLGQIGTIAGAATLVSLGCAALAILFLRMRGVRSPGLVLTSMIPNNANMGMSLCALSFGELGLSLATAYYATTALLNFTLGLHMVASDRGGLREVLGVPVLHALLLGALVHALSLSVPASIDAGLTLLAQAAIPAMLFSLGHRLARTKPTSFGLATQGALIRVLGGLALGYGVIHLLPMPPVAQHVTLLQASMPSAVMSAVVAEKYDQDPELVASTVALSTLLSLLVIPVLLSQLLG